MRIELEENEILISKEKDGWSITSQFTTGISAVRIYPTIDSLIEAIIEWCQEEEE